jgi:small GTP-binding protein
MDRVKIILLGKEGVGKTTLCLRIAYGKYYSNQESTIGIAFMSKRVSHKERTFDLNIWDTAGAERFDAFSRIYIRGSHFCLICFDEPNLAEIDKYVEKCREQSLKTEILLAVTKYDQLDKPHEEFIDVENYARNNELKLFYTSAKDDIGVEDILTYIASKCYQIVPEKPQEHTPLLLKEEPKNKICCW